jgi:hypothetical protein
MDPLAPVMARVMLRGVGSVNSVTWMIIAEMPAWLGKRDFFPVRAFNVDECTGMNPMEIWTK